MVLTNLAPPRSGGSIFLVEKFIIYNGFPVTKRNIFLNGFDPALKFLNLFMI